MTQQNIPLIFEEISARYPKELRNYLSSNRIRLIWQSEKALRLTPENGTMIDIGAGLSPFALICAYAGLKVTIVDDFQDPMHKDNHVEDFLNYCEELGITVISGDIFKLNIAPPENGFDLIVSMDSMEHWHQSPKELFHTLYNMLKSGGTFWIGVPNSVNLRKRITVPFGYGKWSSMHDWYESPVFRGHVREPDIGDLQYIAKNLGFSEFTIEGKNWLGYRSTNALIKWTTPLVDKLLQLNPALCSDIYLEAKK